MQKFIQKQLICNEKARKEHREHHILQLLCFFGAKRFRGFYKMLGNIGNIRRALDKTEGKAHKQHRYYSKANRQKAMQVLFVFLQKQMFSPSILTF